MGSSNKVEDFQSSGAKYGEKHEHDPEFDGPIKKRSCTDILCLLLFLIFIGAWIAVAVYAFINGNPERLIYPSNSNGEICGRGNYLTKPKLIFFDLSRCAKLSALTGCPTPQVCVAECPDSFGRPWAEVGEAENTDTSVKRRMFPYCGPKMTEAQITDDTITVKDLIRDKICPPWWVPSKTLLGRCVPNFETTDDNQVVTNDTVIIDKDETPENEVVNGGVLKKAINYIGKVIDVRSFGERVYSDLATTWWMVLLALLLATVLSLVWIILMKFVAAVMVWASLILSVLLLVVSCVFCFWKYWQLKDSPNAGGSWLDEDFSLNLSAYTELSITWLVLFIISVVTLVIVLIILIFLRTRIKLAVELIEEGSIAVGDMLSTLAFPVVPFVFEIIVIAWFILVAAFLASVGEQSFMLNLSMLTGLKSVQDFECEGEIPPENVTAVCPNARCDFFKYGTTELALYLQIFNIFGLLWGLFFISAMEEMIMAGAFAAWYWTRDKKNLASAPLAKSFHRTFRYHLGTLAFGSLIIAIIRMIRLVIHYIQERMREYRQDNPLVKAILCMCACCFWCLETFMKFINRNAYVMTAIYGKNFCWSAKEAFSLLMRNIARVAVLDKITDFLLLLGKLVIVGTMGVLSFYIFSGRIDQVKIDDLNYYFVPVFVIILGSFFIADVFFDVYEMAVDTLFLCFLEDIERNDGSAEKPYYMSKDLRKILSYVNDGSRPPTARSS
eukprot:maker-scaffold38_size502422-snap-gene-1.13 protein:Tk05861 transcript:maker-scaffold38_size502422-snap-gene-1.13-mRNA-1 annotation:"hypothetical protein DAPPUDRAFT_305570"